MFESKLLGTMGFYIFSFICLSTQLQGRGSNKSKIAYEYIANGLGLSDRAVKEYVKTLWTHKLITKKREPLFEGTYGEFTGYDKNEYSINKGFTAFDFYNVSDVKPKVSKEETMEKLTESKEKIIRPPKSYYTFMPDEGLDFLDD